jgi:2-octaprenyl-6-methoxyphenol hydroxylase
MTRPSSPSVSGHAAAVADVVIVGGGLIGLTLGLAFAKAGLSPAVIDRAAPAAFVDEAFDGRASAIAYASCRALEGLGIWHHVAEAEPIREIRVSDDESPLFLHYDHTEIGDAPFGHMVENRVMRRALYAALEEAPAVQLIAPAEVRAVNCGETTAEVHLANGRRLRAPLVVAADGKDSPIRRAADIRSFGWRYPQDGIVCTVKHERPHYGIAEERFLPAGPFAILPLTENRVSLVWTERADLAPTIMALGDAGFQAELEARFGDYLGPLTPVGPRWRYPLGFHLAETYVRPRLALIGDAAHLIHPIAGQGLNLGLRDVAALAEVAADATRLGLDIGGLPVLERYQRWRRFDNLLFAGITDGLNRLFSNPIAPVRLARDLGLAAVNRMPPLKRFFMRHARGTIGELPRLLKGEVL